jgi:hypothetical protein
MNNIFIRASRESWRFPSVRGDLTNEQLWQMPLIAKSGFDLNSVACGLNQMVKNLGEENFVEVRVHPARTSAEGKLELVKYVIAVKQEEISAAEKRADRNSQRAKILDALAARENEELTKASREDLLAKLAEIDAQG